jgi:hypothetical protein
VYHISSPMDYSSTNQKMLSNFPKSTTKTELGLLCA